METEAGIGYRIHVNPSDWSVWAIVQAAPGDYWGDSLVNDFDSLLRDLAQRDIDTWYGISETTLVWRRAVTAAEVWSVVEEVALALTQCRCVAELESRAAAQEVDLEPLELG